MKFWGTLKKPISLKKFYLLLAASEITDTKTKTPNPNHEYDMVCPLLSIAKEIFLSHLLFTKLLISENENK